MSISLSPCRTPWPWQTPDHRYDLSILRDLTSFRGPYESRSPSGRSTWELARDSQKRKAPPASWLLHYEAPWSPRQQSNVGTNKRVWEAILQEGAVEQTRFGLSGKNWYIQFERSVEHIPCHHDRRKVVNHFPMPLDLRQATQTEERISDQTPYGRWRAGQIAEIAVRQSSGPTFEHLSRVPRRHACKNKTGPFLLNVFQASTRFIEHYRTTF